VIETFGGSASAPEAARELSKTALDKIYAAAQPGVVFSPPVVSGAYTVITASEVAAGGGFGFGGGSGPASAESAAGITQETAGGSGAGAGGGSMGRPVAAIVVGPEGVEVKPIVDRTKIAIAALGAWSAIGMMLMRARAKAR
jgi:uncharacterized spore protein YtfJ